MFVLSRLMIVCAVFFASIASASAAITIKVDLSEQRMTVQEDGVTKYVWPVSTGRQLRWTRVGRFGVNFLSRHHRSRKYDDTPMPYSIFYDGNRAIHGTSEVNRLGSRASHGCVRLSITNAATLYAMVERNRHRTRIIITS